MTRKYSLNKCLYVGLVGFCVISLTNKTLAHQSNIIPDNTLGVESSRVITNDSIDIKIDGGALRDRNLFHSFSEFNINDGQSVYFVNPSGVGNIFTRVTGGNGSNIFGTLGVDGAANLFLINPNGIVFGENASLDVRGSFVGTTANGVQFGEQGTFSATNPKAPGLLTVNPSALFFNQVQGNGGIIVQSKANAGISPAGDNATGLRVPDGESLLLLGGDINIDGGELKAYGGNIELTGLSAPGNVGLTFSGNNPSLNLSDGIERGDLFLSNGAVVNVRSDNGGNIKINARNVDLTGESKLRAGIDKGLGTPDSQGGDIIINATGITTLTGDSFIANVIDERGFGKTGETIINTGSLNLSDGSFINSSILQFASGDAGNIFINVKDTVSLTDGGIYSAVNAEAVGNGGEINIKAGSIELRDGASLDVSTFGQGNSGDIFLEASNSVSLVDSLIYSNIEAGGIGNGGNININSGSLSITDGSGILALLSGADVEENVPGGQGNGGDININVSDAVTIAGVKNGFSSNIYSFVGIGAIGNGGDININADTLSLMEGSEINAKTLGQGNAGNITINAGQSISLDGSGDVILSDGSNGTLFTRIINSVDPDAVGNAGNIQLNTGTLSVTNGAFISSSTHGKGDGGNITINASDTVTFDGGSHASSDIFSGGSGKGGNIRVITGTLSLTNASELSSNIFSGGSGKGGDIRLTIGTLSLTNGSLLSTNVSGSGNAGNIFVEARDNVKLDGVQQPSEFNGTSFYRVSQIQSDLLTGSVGKGGDIQITTESLSVTNGAQISADTDGQGDAGNITINADNKVIFDGFDTNSEFMSRVSTNGGSNSIGNGGNIRINTGELLLKNGGDISTINSGQGNGGDIFLDVENTITFDGVGISNFLPSSASTFAVNGNAGNINIKTGSLFLTNGGRMSTQGFGQDNNTIVNAGNITINARDTIKIDGTNSSLSTGLNRGAGKGGDIKIKTGSLFVTNGAFLSSLTNAQGDAGNIIINASDTVTFDQGSYAATAVLSNAIGDGGDIEITTGLLSVTNSSFLGPVTIGKGNAGNIIINASDNVTFDQGSLAVTAVDSNAIGDGGDIEITTGLLSFTNSSNLASFTSGRGDAGNIIINADTITFDQRSSAATNVTSNAIGDAGNIYLTTNSLSVTNGAELNSSTSGEGNGGDIIIDAKDQIIFDGVGSNNRSSGVYTTVESDGVGNAGGIKLTTGSLSLTNGGQISASTSGRGNGGKIDIDTRDRVTFNGTGSNGRSSGVFSVVDSTGIGNAGGIKLTTASLSVSNGGVISASTGGQGDGGDIIIDARDTVTLDDKDNNESLTGIFSIVGPDGVGKGGKITLTTDSLFLTNSALLSAFTLGKGDGGNIFIDATDSISLSNSSAIDSSVFPGGEGKGGEIDIHTRTLTLTGGSQINAGVVREFGNLPGGKGRGGEITINASKSVTLSGISSTGSSSGILTLTQRGADGDAGNITVTTDEFLVTDGAIVTATTSNDRKAGDITINANTFAAVNGGQVVNTTRSSGDAGTITLNVTDTVTLSGTDPNYNNRLALIQEQITSSEDSTDRVSDFLLVEEGAASGLFASTSADSTGKGGSIFIDPRIVTIEDGAEVSVGSDGTGDAGNIFLQAGTLKLDNGSISAQTASTLGGNITLKLEELLLLRNNSQISTTAGTAQAGGDGGNIDINSPFIVAIPNEDSDITANAFTGRGGNVNIAARGIFGIESRPEPTDESDITASSQLGIDGETNINTADTSSIQNSFTGLSPSIDTDALIANSCIVRGNQRQENSFRITGSGALPPNRPGENLVSNYTTGEVRGVETASRPWKKGDPIIEPQGLYRLSDGRLLLSRECSG